MKLLFAAACLALIAAAHADITCLLGASSWGYDANGYYVVSAPLVQSPPAPMPWALIDNVGASMATFPLYGNGNLLVQTYQGVHHSSSYGNEDNLTWTGYLYVGGDLHEQLESFELATGLYTWILDMGQNTNGNFQWVSWWGSDEIRYRDTYKFHVYDVSTKSSVTLWEADGKNLIGYNWLSLVGVGNGPNPAFIQLITTNGKLTAYAITLESTAPFRVTSNVSLHDADPLGAAFEAEEDPFQFAFAADGSVSGIQISTNKTSSTVGSWARVWTITEFTGPVNSNYPDYATLSGTSPAVPMPDDAPYFAAASFNPTLQNWFILSSNTYEYYHPQSVESWTWVTQIDTMGNLIGQWGPFGLNEQNQMPAAYNAIACSS